MYASPFLFGDLVRYPRKIVLRFKISQPSFNRIKWITLNLKFNPQLPSIGVTDLLKTCFTTYLQNFPEEKKDEYKTPLPLYTVVFANFLKGYDLWLQSIKLPAKMYKILFIDGGRISSVAKLVGWEYSLCLFYDFKIKNNISITLELVMMWL